MNTECERVPSPARSRRPIFDEGIKMAMAGIQLGTTHGLDQLVG